MCKNHTGMYGSLTEAVSKLIHLFLGQFFLFFCHFIFEGKCLWLWASYLISLCLLVFVYLFIGCIMWLFILVCGFLSCCGMQAPECVGSVVVAHGLSCSLACGILVSWARIEPVSPALEGRCFTSGPPGKSHALACQMGLRKHHYKQS